MDDLCILHINDNFKMIYLFINWKTQFICGKNIETRINHNGDKTGFKLINRKGFFCRATLQSVGAKILRKPPARGLGEFNPRYRSRNRREMAKVEKSRPSVTFRKCALTIWQPRTISEFGRRERVSRMFVCCSRNHQAESE